MKTVIWNKPSAVNEHKYYSMINIQLNNLGFIKLNQKFNKKFPFLGIYENCSIFCGTKSTGTLYKELSYLNLSTIFFFKLYEIKILLKLWNTACFN